MNTPRTPTVAVAVVVALLAGATGTVASTTTVSGASAVAVPTDDTAVADATGIAPPAVAATTTPERNGTTIVTDGEVLVLEPAPNQTVRGETALEPGTNLTVDVEGPSFLRTNTATVTDEGTFDATFDLRGVSPGVTVSVSVSRDGQTLAQTEAGVECSGDSDCRTTGEVNDETTTAITDGAVQAITEVAQNRTASIDVLFGSSETLSVSIGGPEVNYVVNGTIHDRDGDGRATLLFDTGLAGTDVPTLGVVDGGERRVVEASSETSLDSPLAPGSYDVTLYHGPNATGEPAAKGRLVVFESTSDSPVASSNTTIVTGGEGLVLEPAPNQTVRGETALEPGTNLSVEIEGESFFTTSVATVAENGTFEVTIDLSGASGEQLEVRAYRDGTTLAVADGKITCRDGCGSTTVTTSVDGGGEPAPGTADSGNRFLDGVGMIAVGGVLAVVGVGVLLGLFRR